MLLNPQEHLTSLCERAKDIMIDAFGFEEVEMNNFKDDVRRQYQVLEVLFISICLIFRFRKSAVPL